MLAANFGGERLPSHIEPGAPVTALRFFEVRQCLVVVFALTRINDAHAQGAEDFRRHAGMGLGQTLSRGLGHVMAQTLQLRVSGAVQPSNQPVNLLGAEP
jgi:hypothetical protein